MKLIDFDPSEVKLENKIYPFSLDSPLAFEEVCKAYFDCRKNKRNTTQALGFEFNLEKELFQLFLDLRTDNYKIGRSVAFVVEQPKVREIWAADFRDRIVHHIIYNRIFGIFYNSFIRDSYACIPGRGVLDGSQRLTAGMRSITNNFQKNAYYLKADVRNFFVSIDKNILYDIIRRRFEKEARKSTKLIYCPLEYGLSYSSNESDWLLKLIYKVIFHDPRVDCILRSSRETFKRVPRHKSLWTQDSAKGLPIGNLTSQFFANVYLNELDQFSKHQLSSKYYYRYVDDFLILNESSEILNDNFLLMSQFLTEKLALDLHPFKKRIAPIDLGIDFIGFFHKPFYSQIRERTAKKMVSHAHQWRKNAKNYELSVLYDLRNSMNSYFGVSRWVSTYNLRRHVGNQVSCLFIRADDHYTKLIVPRKNKHFRI